MAGKLETRILYSLHFFITGSHALRGSMYERDRMIFRGEGSKNLQGEAIWGSLVKKMFKHKWNTVLLRMILSDSCCRFDLYQPLKIIQVPNVPKICPFRKNRLKLDTSKYPANSQQGFANTKPRYRSKFRARPQTASNDKREALLGPKRESLDFQLQQLAQCHEANDDRGSLEIRSSLPHLYVRICPIKCESTL